LPRSNIYLREWIYFSPVANVITADQAIVKINTMK